ncbi:MAG: hypothetical protein ACTSPY_02865 [Candidatus Helarchaeota archaeon]
MKINDLFFELSHEGRYKILLLIDQEKRKHIHIEKELNFTGPEVSRHLKRLKAEKLVEKTVDGYYKITNFGRVITTILPFFENCLNFIDFINSHNFSPIPPEYLFQVGLLTDLELRTITMENIELWTSLITNSSQYIYAITDQLQKSIIPIIQKKIQSDNKLEIKAIITKELFKKFLTPKKLPFNINVLQKQIDIINNVRIADKLNLSLIISELGSLIFLKAGNTIDYNQCIYGKSIQFIKWTKKIFDIFWNNSDLIKPSDIIFKTKN